MLRAIDVAKYFLAKDSDQKVFTKNLIEKNGRKFYEGNARLNKYLHMAQNFYIAKTGNKLFKDDLYAYDNGAVALNVQENYAVLLSRKDIPTFEPDVRDFLDRIYKLLENATLDELIELSHEDSEWDAKHKYYSKERQQMDSLAHIEEYKEQYHDVLQIMERMEL